jgi:predicted MPP superfamily phosphohydrolase
MGKITDAFQAVNLNLLLNFLILLSFILVDFVWLRSLPSLGISYGSGNPTFILFSILRVGFFVLCVSLQFVLRQVEVNILHLSLWSSIVPNLLLLGFGIYGFCIEPFELTETHIEIQVPGLSHPVRIIQLSDIHVEHTTKREQSLPEFVESLHPDMIVITGDLINESYVNNPQTIEDLRELVGKFYALLGVYAVNGNVETPQSLQLMLQGLDVHVLQNEVVRIPELGSHFVLVGLNYVKWSLDKEELTILMSHTQPDDFSLLLYHKPDLIYAARDLNVDLYVAGNTHGGQVRLPCYGALFINSRYGRKFEMGLYQVDKTTLFVSRGLGFTGGNAPRIRFLAPPEVVTIDLVPKSN